MLQGGREDQAIDNGSEAEGGGEGGRDGEKEAVIGESPPQPTPTLSCCVCAYHAAYVHICMLSLRRVTFLRV